MRFARAVMGPEFGRLADWPAAPVPERLGGGSKTTDLLELVALPFRHWSRKIVQDRITEIGIDSGKDRRLVFDPVGHMRQIICSHGVCFDSDIRIPRGAITSANAGVRKPEEITIRY